MKKALFLLAASLLLAAVSATARSYSINKPGELPVHVRPAPGGGYNVQRPGQLSIRVRPNP